MENSHSFIALCLSGIELIFFITPIFYISLTVIITYQYCGYCAVLAQHPGLHFFFPFCPPPSARRLGWAKCWEGTQPGWVIPTNQRDTPDHMSCSTINAEGEKERDPHGYGVCLPKQVLHMLRHNFPEVAKHLPTNGEQRINFSFCFA